MEQSPSSQADTCSSSQEISYLLWNLKVHYCVSKTLSLARWIQYTPSNLDFPLHRSFQRICPGLRFCVTFHNMQLSYSKGLTTYPTPKLLDHLLSAVNNCLFSILADIFHYFEAASSIWNLKMHMWWQRTHLTWAVFIIVMIIL